MVILGGVIPRNQNSNLMAAKQRINDAKNRQSRLLISKTAAPSEKRNMRVKSNLHVSPQPQFSNEDGELLVQKVKS